MSFLYRNQRNRPGWSNWNRPHRGPDTEEEVLRKELSNAKGRLEAAEARFKAVEDHKDLIEKLRSEVVDIESRMRKPDVKP